MTYNKLTKAAINFCSNFLTTWVIFLLYWFACNTQLLLLLLLLLSSLSYTCILTLDYIDDLMAEAYKMEKDNLADHVPAPMTSLYKKPDNPDLLIQQFQTRFNKK